MLSHSCAAPLSSCLGNYNTSGKEAASTCWAETTPPDCSAGVLLVPDAGSLREPQHLAPHWQSARCCATKVCPNALAIIRADFRLLVAAMFITLLIIALHSLFPIHLQHPGLLSLLLTPCPSPACAPSPSLGCQRLLPSHIQVLTLAHFKNTHTVSTWIVFFVIMEFI